MAAADGADGTTHSPEAPIVQPAARPRASAVILFQGDSITDAGRERGETRANRGLGSGYAMLVAAQALRQHADLDLRFYNRGVSGDTVPELRARWEADTVALEPDILTILIGVNDFWKRVSGSSTATAGDYETGFAALLELTRVRLPGTQLVVLEPFILHTGAVNRRWLAFDERRTIARRVAGAAGASFVALQDMFDALARHTPADHWLSDGVHPTSAGHAAIARRVGQAIGL